MEKAKKKAKDQPPIEQTIEYTHEEKIVRLKTFVLYAEQCHDLENKGVSVWLKEQVFNLKIYAGLALEELEAGENKKSLSMSFCDERWKIF